MTTGSSLAAVIAAVASVITATGGLVAAVTYLLPAIKRAEQTRAQIEHVAQLVEEHAASQSALITNLTAALSDHAVPAPATTGPPTPAR